MANTWLAHVKKTMALHPGKPFKEVLKAAKKTYKKTAKTAKYAVTGKKQSGGKSRKGGARKSRKGGARKSRRRTRKSRK